MSAAAGAAVDAAVNAAANAEVTMAVAWLTSLGGGVQLTVVVAALVWVASAPWRVAGRRPAVLQRGGDGRRPPWWRRWGRHAGGSGDGPPQVEIAVVLDLVGAALSAGAGVPRAIEATGRAVGGAQGSALRSVAAALLLGAPWDTAWSAAPARLAPLAAALRPAWTHGAAPREALRVAGQQINQDTEARARTEAARLSVRLVLPLGLCFLPAFVLVGLVPVLLSLGSGLLE